MFFSNPKTGSESIRDLLTPCSDVLDGPFRTITLAEPFYSHIRPEEARRAFKRFGWNYEKYYRFVFVRNPWTRLVSLFEMIKRLDPAFVSSFGTWLQQSGTDGLGGGGPDYARWRRFGTNTLESFAGDAAGNLLVDEVFRMEDIDRVPEVLRQRGIPLPVESRVPYHNVSGSSRNLQVYYTPELIALVRMRHAAEIDRFGYEYPA